MITKSRTFNAIDSDENDICYMSKTFTEILARANGKTKEIDFET